MPDITVTFDQALLATKIPEEKRQLQVEVIDVVERAVGTLRAVTHVYFQGILSEDVLLGDGPDGAGVFRAKIEVDTFAGKPQEQLKALGKALIETLAKFLQCLPSQISGCRIREIPKDLWVEVPLDTLV